MQINEKCKAEVKNFLMHHNTPTIHTSTTIKDGYVSCINPIKTICGAELICSPKTKKYLLELTR
jgi:hypothetical protein